MTGFADPEAIAIAGLSQLDSVRVLSVLPANLAEVLTTQGIVQVDRVGGGTTLSLDQALLDVESYGPTRVDAKELAYRVHAFMLYRFAGYRSLGGVVANVLSSVGPSQRPYGNPNVFRVGATYQVTVHNQI